MAGNRNSGRRPQPTQLKLLRGNPGKRRIYPESEPQPAPVTEEFDTPPIELKGNKIAEKEWRRVAPLLRSCGLVTQAEQTALTALCLEWSTYLTARKDPERARDADHALSQCQRLWSELGLTPSGRAKLARLPPAPGATSSRPTPASKWGGLI